MNGTIMFSIKMQDMMSGSLMKLGSNSNAVFTKMINHTKQITDKNKVLGMSYNELQSRIKEVENTISRSTIPSQIRSAKRELEALQKQSNKHIGNTNSSNGSNSGGIGMGTIAGGTILGNIATAGISMIGSGISTMIQKSMDKETAISGMSTFLGKSGAKDAYSNIQKDAEATPFDTASLLEVNRSLISAGANAKQARTDSMNLANAVVAVGGSNDTLTRMAANMQQIKTVGKATSMDIRQFGIAGINIYSMLSKSTGKSIAEVKEMDVTYAQLSKALQMAADKGGIYEGALNNAMNTQQGKWSNFTESFTNKLADIGTAFAPVTNSILDIGTKLAGTLTYVEQFANWLTSGSTSVGIFTAVVGGLTAAFVTYQAIMGGIALWTGIVTKAQWLWNLALTANPIGIVVVAIAGLVAGVAIAYNKFEKFRAIVDGVWGVLKEVGSLIKSILMGDLSGIATSLKNIFTGKSFNNAYNVSINQSAIDRHKKIKDRATQAAKDKADDISKTRALAASNEASGKSTGDTVAGAGPRVINIHVGKFFDNLQFTTLNTGESANEIEKIVMECFARVVYNGSKMV